MKKSCYCFLFLYIINRSIKCSFAPYLTIHFISPDFKTSSEEGVPTPENLILEAHVSTAPDANRLSILGAITKAILLASLKCTKMFHLSYTLIMFAFHVEHACTLTEI